MDRTYLEVFDEYFSHLKFNRQLAQDIYRFQVKFVNKNEEHMAFFGGNLTGVNVVRFTPRDQDEFFSTILKVDEEDLDDAMDDVPDHERKHRVKSDVFNLTSMYLIHKFMTSPLIDNRAKERAALDVALIFNYRVMTSLLSHYFKYPADPKTAQLTYANLSYKYILKKLGSWQEVFMFRAREMIAKEGIHFKTFMKFNNDADIGYVITDSQGRVRDMLKNIYAEFVKVHESGDRLQSTSGVMVDLDGKEVLKDKSKGIENYINYAIAVSQDRNSFIKDELVQVVIKLMHTVHPGNFQKALEWMSVNQDIKLRKDIEDIIRKTIIHSYQYLNTHSTILNDTKDLPGFLSRLRGAYLSSRSTNEDLLEIRDLGRKIVIKATKVTNENSISAIRTSLFLYICLRAYTKQHYS